MRHSRWRKKCPRAKRIAVGGHRLARTQQQNSHLLKSLLSSVQSLQTTKNVTYMPTIIPIRSSQNTSTVLAAAQAAAASGPDLNLDLTLPSMDSPEIFNKHSSAAHPSPSVSQNQMHLIPSPSLSPLPFFLDQESPQILAEEDNKIPGYKMCRYLESVKDTWREWTQGLAGFPAVQDFERDLGVSGAQSKGEGLVWGKKGSD